MGLHDGHRQRSKRRYLALGAEGMEDHQLLELLLFYAIPRQDTNETAHRLIQRFGSLQGVLHAAPEELTSVEGVGENAAVLVRLVGDMALRARCSSLPQKVLNSPDRTGAYFMELLAGEKKEMLYQVCLDAKGKLLTCRCISKGTVAASPVSVRQVVENALYAGASSIILAHNHPSGVALPSQQDLLVTRQIQEALAPLGIRLADHIIVADSDYVSMAKAAFWRDKRRILCRSKVCTRPTSPPATSPRPSTSWRRAWKSACGEQVLWASPAPARRTPWPRSSSRSTGPRWCWPTTRRWPPSCARNSGSFSPTTRWSISSPTTTTTSRRPICPTRTPISPRTPPPTRRSTACGCPPPARCWSGGTSSWCRPSPASTAWASRTTLPSMMISLRPGMTMERDELLRRLVEIATSATTWPLSATASAGAGRHGGAVPRLLQGPGHPCGVLR